MKLGKLLAVGVVTAVASLVMCVSAFAATNVKLGEPENDGEGDYGFPIIVNSSDYNKISGAKITVKYDTSKYDYSYVDVAMQKKIAAATFSGKGNATGCAVVWGTASSAAYKLSGDTVIGTFYVTPKGAFSPDDFSFEVDYLNVVLSGTPTVVAQEEVAPFVTYNLTEAKIQELGYVQGMKAVIYDASDDSELKTVNTANNCIDEEDGSYTFVLRLKSSAKKDVYAKFFALTSATEDAAEGTWKEVDLGKTDVVSVG